MSIRLLLAWTVVLASSGGAIAQDRWLENFEDYEAGPLAGHGGWEAWNGDPIAADFNVTSSEWRDEIRSLEIDGDDDALRVFAAEDLGDAYGFSFSTWVYVPSSLASTQLFILLNTYPARAFKDWSLQLELDGAAGVIRDRNHIEDSLPLIRDDWVKINVVVDLENDVQTVVYEGEILLTKSWTAGVAKGERHHRIQAVDLFANGSAEAIFYDTMFLEPLLPRPACPTDLDDNGATAFGDLLTVLSTWGPCEDDCPADLDGSGDVAFPDLLAVLSAWGPCLGLECLGSADVVLDANGEWEMPDMNGIDVVPPWFVNRDRFADPFVVTQSPVAGTVLTGPQVALLDVIVSDDEGADESCDTTANLIDLTSPSITIAGVVDMAKLVAPVSVVPDIQVTDAVDAAPSFDVFLDGAAYTPGTPISSLGFHVVRVHAEDAAGNRSSDLVRFEICPFPQLPAVSVVAGLTTSAGPGGSFSMDATILLAASEFEAAVSNLYSIGLWALNENGLPLNERPIRLVGSESVDGGYDFTTVDAFYQEGYWTLHFSVDATDENLIGVPTDLEITGTGQHALPGEFDFTTTMPAMVNPDPIGFLAASGVLNGDPFAPPPPEPEWPPCKWKTKIVIGPTDVSQGTKDTSCLASFQSWTKFLRARGGSFFGDATAADNCFGAAVTSASVRSHAIIRMWLEGPEGCCDCEIDCLFMPAFTASAQASAGRGLAAGVIDIASTCGCTTRAIGGVEAGAEMPASVTFGAGAGLGASGPEVAANLSVEMTLVTAADDEQDFIGNAVCTTQQCSVIVAIVSSARLNVSADGWPPFYAGAAAAGLYDAVAGVTLVGRCTTNKGPCVGVSKTLRYD